MKHQFKDSGAKALIFLDELGSLVEEVIKDTDIQYLICTGLGVMLPQQKEPLPSFLAEPLKPFVLHNVIPFISTLELGEKANHSKLPIDSVDAPVMLQYTGGTTGLSKGAMLTHRSLIANMLQTENVLSQEDRDGKPLLIYREEVSVAPLPLYHIAGFTMNLLCLPLHGCHTLLITNWRDTTALIRSVKGWRPTVFLGINTLFINLLNHPELSSIDLSSLKCTFTGGAALKESVGNQWHK